MADFSSFVALASRLVTANGATIVHTKGPYQQAAAFAPEDDQSVELPAPAATQTIKAVISPYTPLFGLGIGRSFERASQKFTESRSLTIAAKGLSFAPEVGDMFTFEGKVWTSMKVEKTSPDGVTAIKYKVGVGL